MTQRRVVSGLLFSTGVGAAVAVLAGDQNAISLRIWLAVTAVWFATRMLRGLLEVVPLEPERLRLLTVWKREAKEPMSPRYWALRELDSLVSRSTGNDRSFDQQLRPRLDALAAHLLPINHSVNPRTQPDRAAAVLGDVAWILDPTVTGRVPSLDEMERFINRLAPNAGIALEAQT